MEPTVHDVLAFHRVDRAAYDHLLSLGAGRRPARDAVALLMWLHRRAGVDAVSRVPALVRTPAAAARLVGEARAALLHGAGAPTTTPPLLSLLCGEAAAADPCVRRPLLATCGPAAEAARRGVAEVLGGVEPAPASSAPSPLHPSAAPRSAPPPHHSSPAPLRRNLEAQTSAATVAA